MTALRQGGSPAVAPALAELATPSLIGTGLVVAAGLLIGGYVAGVVLLALAVVAGLPHGASDLEAGRHLLRFSGPIWWAPFLLGYLGLIAVTLAAWAIAPVAALVVFLLLSIVHFGMQDAPDRSPLAVIAHGGVPIVVPALVHPQEVERLFAILISDRAQALTAAIFGPVSVLWLLTVALLVWRTLGARDRSRAVRGGPALADLVLVGLLFAAASPLVAFSFYFALLHTPRALFEQRHRSANKPASAFQAIGLTALACLIGLLILLFSSALTLESAIVRTSFVLLSALTVPHMTFEYVASVVKRECASISPVPRATIPAWSRPSIPSAPGSDH